MWKLATSCSGTFLKASPKQKTDSSISMKMFQAWVWPSTRPRWKSSKLLSELEDNEAIHLMTRLIQLKREDTRRVASVEEPQLRLLDGCCSIYELANLVIAKGSKLSDVVHQQATGDLLDYDPIYRGQSEWCILPPIDHP